MSGNLTMQDNRSCDAVLAGATELMQIRSARPTDPVFDTDHMNLVSTVLLWTQRCWGPSVSCSSNASVLWNVSDFVLDPDLFGYTWKSDPRFIEYV